MKRKISEGKPKTTKRTTKKKQAIKKSKPYQTVKNLLSWSFSESKKREIDWLCEKLFEWSHKKDALTIVGFCHEHGIPYRTFINLAEKHERLKAIKQYAKEQIGLRREKLAMFKEFGANPNVIVNTLREYHPVWRKCYDEEQEHKKEQSAAAYLAEYFKDKNMELPDLDEAKRKTTTPDK